MSCYLNRQTIVDKIGDIIDTAKRQIIMVAPYIKLSETTYQKLVAANSKGVEIIIIYREDQVGNMERTKLNLRFRENHSGI